MQFGILEGFFGAPWSFAARKASLPFLRDEGIGLYLYAPKADHRLRTRWDVAHEPAVADQLRSFSRACRASGVDFAIGLSPLELYGTWTEEGPSRLHRRIDQLLELGIDGLGLFFDDMRGDLPRLALTQAEIAASVRARHPDLRLWLCPTYYTPHAILDKVFGQRPADYLRDLGQALPEDIEVFWTGEAVCSKSYSVEHLEAVHAELGRKVAIWDNYPVNDGPRMCKRLHLTPPGGRPAELADWVTTWCINPMNQSVASRLPIAAIVRGMRQVDVDVEELATELYGPAVATPLIEALAPFQQGLDELDPATWLPRFQGSEPICEEIRHWLRGESIVGPECLTDTEDDGISV